MSFLPSDRSDAADAAEPSSVSPWRLSVAPMLDWTDRHCRYFHRLLTRHTLLYTEMVNAGGILYGGTERHLRYNAEEHPVALQLGGNEPDKLAQAARLGEALGWLTPLLWVLWFFGVLALFFLTLLGLRLLRSLPAAGR